MLYCQCNTINVTANVQNVKKTKNPLKRGDTKPLNNAVAPNIEQTRLRNDLLCRVGR